MSVIFRRVGKLSCAWLEVENGRGWKCYCFDILIAKPSLKQSGMTRKPSRFRRFALLRTARYFGGQLHTISDRHL
eukprot:s275_g11.t1